MSDRGRRRPRREPEPWAGPEGFVPAGSPDHLAREKEEARKLRATRWWKEKLARGLCHWCGRAFPTSELTMDHVVPLVRGGRSTRDNIVCACRECNAKKKYLLPMEWEGYLKTLKGGG